MTEQKKKKYNTYSKSLAQKVIDKYAQPGMTILKIGKLQHFPHFRTIYRWKREHEWFREALEQAKMDKAEEYADRALEEAENLTSKRMAPVAKVKIDTLKWRAGVDNPARFANKQVIEGNPDKPIQILVDTGIRRELPNGKKEKVVQSEVVQESSQEKEEAVPRGTGGGGQEGSGKAS